MLAACPLALAAVTPLEIRSSRPGCRPSAGVVTLGALKSPWVLQPVFAGFSILSPSWLWIDIPTLVVLVGLFTWAVSGRRMLRVRRVPAWRSATIGVDGPDSYTAFGYANPTRRVLANVLHTRSEVRVLTAERTPRPRMTRAEHWKPMVAPTSRGGWPSQAAARSRGVVPKSRLRLPGDRISATRLT